MANNRLYYACQNVQLNGPSGLNTVQNNAWDSVLGLQSVGVSTNFNLEPIYQMGQLSLYDNFEEIPEVEITLNKVLDGHPTIYQMTMGEGNLVALSNSRCGFRLNLFPETTTLATGTPLTSVTCEPAYVSAVTYTFPTEGNFTEEVTLVSNDKVWSTTPAAVAGGTELQAFAPALMGRRATLDNVNSIFPSSGDGGLPPNSRVQNVTVSMNLGRESIFNLGQRTPYYRYINFPVEITTEIEVIGTQGDLVGVAGSSNVACSNPKALAYKTIKIALCDGMVLDLGSSNKLTSVNQTGGDTGGGNVTMSFSYQTFNDFHFTPPTGASPSADDVVEDSRTFPLT